MNTHWPNNVGILAVEYVFPSRYVEQSELEVFDGASAGKYTVGLGQKRMGFCSDREDINSICLTAVHKLLERNRVKFEDVGRLEVGTETVIDKSKSVKSVLMQLFEPYGVTDIEGIDTTNACYGGTAALFNAISWIESSAWDGRYAVVVAADIAVYAKGPARPTGGAGAVAMLIGADAPLVFDRGLRSTCMRNVYDFYKPDLSSEYPLVDSKLSIKCYLNALDTCYQSYMKKFYKLNGDKVKGLDNFDAVLMHSPYCKLVRKGFAHLLLNDFLHNQEYNGFAHNVHLQKYKNLKLEETYFDREVEKTFINLSEGQFKCKTEPSQFLPSEIGNTYTACLYAGLVSLLISKDAKEIAGNRIVMFSYGSGYAASIFSLSVSDNYEEGSPLHGLMENLSHVGRLLNERQKVSPEFYDIIMKEKEDNYNKAPYVPKESLDVLTPGTYYLSNIDELHRRTYRRVPNLSA